jgi:protein-S-isoprenylcysteine O-methyltransferase Ste14
LAFVGTFLGLAVGLGWGWLWVMTAILGIVLHYAVILPEEAFLSRQFGDAYEDYRRQTRRWL